MPKLTPREKAARAAARYEIAEARRAAVEAARAAARARTAAAKEARIAERESERASALAVATRVPPEFQRWGSTQTRTWALMSAKCLRACRKKSAKADELRAAAANVTRVRTLDPAQCALILENEARK